MRADVMAWASGHAVDDRRRARYILAPNGGGAAQSDGLVL